MDLIRILARIEAIYRHGFDWMPCKSAVLTAARQALSISQQEIFDSQLNGLDFIQREHEGRVANIFLKGNSSARPFVNNNLGTHCLAKVTLRSEDKRIAAKVHTEGGILSSIIFNKPPRQLSRSHFQVVACEIDDTISSLVEDLDYEEHGDASN